MRSEAATSAASAAAAGGGDLPLRAPPFVLAVALPSLDSMLLGYDIGCVSGIIRSSRRSSTSPTTSERSPRR